MRQAQGVEFHYGLGMFMVLKTSYNCSILLTGAKCREWMGCWGLPGLLLIAIVDHSRKFATKHQ